MTTRLYEKQVTERTNPGCAMLSVEDMLNLACYQVMGVDLQPILSNHQRAIALITDHQIKVFCNNKETFIASEPPYKQREMKAHFQGLLPKLQAWRDRAKLAVN